MRFFLTKLMVTLSICFVLSGHASAQTTLVCNQTSEPLYIAVRHNAASLFTANSRTEGWYKLPVRGVLRSCTSFNRYARDHYVVAGVRRGDEIVPVKFDLRRYDIRRTIYVCVPVAHTRFEYRSHDRSDSACSDGYQLARASAGVLGGDNHVDLDLGGDTSGIRAPERLRKVEEPPKDPRSKYEIEFDEKRAKLIADFERFKESWRFGRSDKTFGGFVKRPQIRAGERDLDGAIIATLRTTKGESEIIPYYVKSDGDAIELRAIASMDETNKNWANEVANHSIRTLSWRVTMTDYRFASFCLFDDEGNVPLSCRTLRWFKNGDLVVKPTAGSAEQYELRMDVPNYYYFDEAEVLESLPRHDEALPFKSPILGRL
jgi:hypothetical protein